MKPMKTLLAICGSAAIALTTAVPASAVMVNPSISDTGSASLPGTGAIIQANAWQCNSFIDKCSFTTSAKALRSGASYTVSTISNVATLTAHGISASISSSPSGTVVASNIRSIKWTNTNTWIADINGIADPSVSTLYMSTCSDASGYKSGVKAFASACAGD